MEILNFVFCFNGCIEQYVSNDESCVYKCDATPPIVLVRSRIHMYMFAWRKQGSLVVAFVLMGPGRSVQCRKSR